MKKKMLAGETAPFETQVSLYEDEMRLYKRLINMIANNTAPSGAATFEELEYQDWFEAMVGLYSPDIIDKAKDFSQPFGKIYDRIARYHNDLKFILEGRKDIQDWEKVALAC